MTIKQKISLLIGVVLFTSFIVGSLGYFYSHHQLLQENISNIFTKEAHRQIFYQVISLQNINKKVSQTPKSYKTVNFKASSTEGSDSKPTIVKLKKKQKVEVPHLPIKGGVIFQMGPDESLYMLSQGKEKKSRKRKKRRKKRKSKAPKNQYTLSQVAKSQLLYKKSNIPQNSHLVLLLKDKTLLYNHQKALSTATRKELLSQTNIKSLRNPFNTPILKYSGDPETPYLGMIMPVPKSNLLLLYGKPMKELTWQYYQDLILIAGAFLAAIIFLLLIVLLTIHRLFAPINKLKEVVKLQKEGKEVPSDDPLLSKKGEFQEIIEHVVNAPPKIDQFTPTAEVKSAEKVHVDIDPVTGCYHKQHFEDSADEFIKKTSKDKCTSAFIIVTIDHFEQLNRDLGYRQVKPVLMQLPTEVKKVCSEEDMVFRLDEEKFLVYCHNMDPKKAILMAEEMRSAPSKVHIEKVYSPWESLEITLSLGVVMTNGKNFGSYAEILRMCDQALYHSAEKGHNLVSLWTPDGSRELKNNEATAS